MRTAKGKTADLMKQFKGELRSEFASLERTLNLYFEHHGGSTNTHSLKYHAKRFYQLCQNLNDVQEIYASFAYNVPENYPIEDKKDD